MAGSARPRPPGAEVRSTPADEFAPTEQFAVSVDACVLDEGRNHALRSTKPCGICTSVSSGVGAAATLPLRTMYLKGIRYEVGRVHARSTAPPVLDLVASGALNPSIAVTRTVPFANASEAMGEPDIKVVFTNES